MAPLTALIMVVLLGMTAFAVDVAGMYSEHAQLQNGADSAALAIAGKCATAPLSSPCTAGDYSPAASPYANENALDSMTNVLTANLNTSDPNRPLVSITTQSQDSSGTHFSLVFARALGINFTDIQANAQATWFYPTKGYTALPLTFAPCEFIDDGLAHKILTHGGAPDCNGRNPSNQIIPGGFAWLKPDSTPGNTCSITAEVNKWSQTSTGGSVPSGCMSLFSPSLLGQTVALPVYKYDCTGLTPGPTDPSWGSCKGNNVYYLIKEWAGFKILGWNFPSNSAGPNVFGPGENGIYGTFVGYSADPAQFSGGNGTPNGNVIVARLTN
ncbi:TadE/TadG family type IV pilus assembly protein [Pseudarthrobacter phenanthrenivorans]|uniref:TadE/TadG family type IV pilus assembly protein n=1 Tax=Pseudarthrobacter phenanthrenivorans TaxID=361575 RepID=UPI00344BB29B